MSPVLAALVGMVEAVAQDEGPALVAALSKWLTGQKSQALTLAQQEALERLAVDAQAKASLGG